MTTRKRANSDRRYINRVTHKRRHWPRAHAYTRALEPLGMELVSDALVTDFVATRQIAVTEIGPVRVSTVWLVIDHSFGGRRPLVFETMLFQGDQCIGLDGSTRALQLRYTYEREARIGHKVIARAVRAQQLNGGAT